MVAIDGEFSVPKSTSAQAIERGVRIAIDEINRAGGVLNGRNFDVVTVDNRSMPARGVANIEELAKIPDLVAVFSGRFSPVVIETLKTLHDYKIINLAPWSSATTIVDNGFQPNYVFRLSLRDSLAMPRMLKYATERGFRRVGLLLTNTAWGRSNEEAADTFARTTRQPEIMGKVWSAWGAPTLIGEYRRLIELGVDAVILVVNDDEAAILLRELAQAPRSLLRPLISHWGITGGDLIGMTGPALLEADLVVIQTVSFHRLRPAKVARLMETAKRLYKIDTVDEIDAPVGAAHGYDLMHILARAVQIAGTTDRARIRDALEQVRDYDGLIKHYARPFAPDRHEALDEADFLFARYDRTGRLMPAP